MSSRTPNQDKALKWFIETHDLKPQLSAHPNYYFVDSSGKEVTYLMQHILSDWERWRKEQTR